jgi:hypothetical protein
MQRSPAILKLNQEQQFNVADVKRVLPRLTMLPCRPRVRRGELVSRKSA